MAGPTPTQAGAASEAISQAMTRRALLGARYDAGLARDVIKLLTALEGDLVGQIAAIDVTGVGRAGARRARLNSLLEQARKSIRDNYRRIRVLADRDLNELFDIEAGATRLAIDTAFQDVGFRFKPELPTDSYMNALADDHTVLGRPAADYWNGQSAQLQGAFVQQMELGLQAGETLPQLIRRIRGGMRDGLAMPGIMASSRANAAALARTSAASVGNNARLAVFEANNDVIDEYIHLSRLDSRTSPTCIARAGKRWDAKTKAPIGHTLPFQTPPIHWNCRSVIVVKVTGGDLPTDQNGEAWFKSLDRAEQDRLFGATRAELYRSGDITVGQLFDQSGRPLPLSALRVDGADARIRRTG